MASADSVPLGRRVARPSLSGIGSARIATLGSAAIPTVLLLIGSCVIAGVVILLRGYQFGFSNHNEQIPLILRLQDAAYLAGDWYVDANSQFGPRTYYVALMAAVNQVADLPMAFAGVYALSAVALVAGLMALGRHAGGSWAVAALTPAVALLTSRATLGGNQALHTLLIPAVVALPFVVWAVVFKLRGRLTLAAALLAVATNLHLVIGVQGAIVLGALALWEHEGRRGLLTAGAIYAVLASPTLVGALFFSSDGALSAAQYVEIVAYERHPWHYVLTQFSAAEYVQALSFATIGLAALGYAWFAASREYARLILRTLLVMAPLLFLGYLAVEVWPIKPLAMMQFFRLTVLLNLLVSVLVASWLVCLLQTRRGFAVGLLVLAALIGSTFYPVLLRVAAATAALWTVWTVVGLAHHASKGERRLLIGWVAAVLVAAVPSMLLAGNIVGALGSEKRAIFDFAGTGQFWLASLLLAALAALAVRDVSWRNIGLAGCGLLAGVSLIGLGWAMTSEPHLGGVIRKVAIQEADSPDVDDVARYVRTDTAPDSVFLIPPYAEDFRLRAERAVVVDFKSFSFLASAVEEWRERIGAVSGGFPLPDGLTTGWLSLSTERLEAVACRYDATHIVLERGRGFRGEPMYAGVAFEVFPTACPPEGAVSAGIGVAR